MIVAELLAISALAAATIDNASTASPCMRLRRAISAGQPILAGEAEPAPCTDAAQAFRYDSRGGLALASRDLTQGEIVPAVPAGAFAAVRAGDALHLRVAVGPVVIERDVTALQSAHANERVFVRASGGETFAVGAMEVRP